jgi:type II secretory pathway pseudopilin PulG
MKPDTRKLFRSVATRSPQPVTHNLLPAFTIMEMIVVMVLSGIIIAAALKLYLNYEGLVRGKTKQMEFGKETLQFYQVFRHEFDDADRITSTSSQIIFILPDKPPVQYDFEQNYITRLQNNLIDTFFVTVNDLNIRKDEATGLERVITMELRNYDEIFPVLMVKEYPNNLMMQIRK